MSAQRPRAAAIAALVSCVALASASLGCGGDESGEGPATAESKPRQATLVLDFVPNAVHAGIYRALAQGLYESEGIELEVIEPSSTADTLRLIDAEKADFGIADGIDVATQIDAGRGARGILALLARPAGGLITLKESRIADPAELEGKTVGVTGVPSDDAVLETIVRDAGGDPAALDVVTIGFNGVQALEGGKIAAFTGYIPADGVQVESDGYPTRAFPLDRWGGPQYPGLVVFSTRERIEREPALMQSFVDATVRGYRETLADPDAALDDLIAENPAIDPSLARASLDEYLPRFGDRASFGSFATPELEALSTFLLDAGVIGEPIAPGRYATDEFVATTAGG